MFVKSTISRSSLSRTTGTDVHEKHNQNRIDVLHRRDPGNGQNGGEIVNDIARNEEEDNEIFCLEYFQASMFATLLEDAITALRVLDGCNNEMRLIKAMADMEHLHALKFSVQEPAVKDELYGIEKHNLGKMEYKLNKLVGDRKFLGVSLITTYLDLSLNKNWKHLAGVVNKVVDKDIYYECLVSEEVKNRLSRRELIRQLRQLRNHIKSVVYENDVTIDQLRTQVEDAALNAEIRGRYIANWQLARTEQHHQTIVDRETRPTEAIEYYKQRADQEQRVHNEVELLTNLAITENLQLVENWMNKYDKDMEALDLKIQMKKLDYQNTLDKRIKLENTIAEHQNLVDNWLTFKDEREKERQHRKKMHKAAITVQAWWRGLLVRLQLGPYKPTKKKAVPPPATGKKKK